MGMDLGTAIVGLVLLLICVLPLAFIHYKRVNKSSKMLLRLNQIAQLHNCKINQHEFCGDSVIGIDMSKNFVFFYKQNKQEIFSHIVNLSEVKSCQIVKKTRIVKKANSSIAIIEQVKLDFVPFVKNTSESNFELYDEDTDMQLSGELQFAERWAKLMNQRLMNK